MTELPESQGDSDSAESVDFSIKRAAGQPVAVVAVVAGNKIWGFEHHWFEQTMD